MLLWTAASADVKLCTKKDFTFIENAQHQGDAKTSFLNQ